MHTFNVRAGRWPLALTIVAVAALGACADEPAAPKSTPRIAGTPALAMDGIQVTVTNASGGSEVGSLQWAASQVNNHSGNPGGGITFDASLAAAPTRRNAAPAEVTSADTEARRKRAMGVRATMTASHRKAGSRRTAKATISVPATRFASRAK